MPPDGFTVDDGATEEVADGAAMLVDVADSPRSGR